MALAAHEPYRGAGITYFLLGSDIGISFRVENNGWNADNRLTEIKKQKPCQPKNAKNGKERKMV